MDPNTIFDSSVIQLNSNILFRCIKGSENYDVNYLNSSIVNVLNTNLYIGVNYIIATISDSSKYSIKTTEFTVSQSTNIQNINLYFYLTKSVLFKLKNSISNIFYNTSILQLNSKVTFTNSNNSFFYLVKDSTTTEFNVILSLGNYDVNLVLSNTISFDFISFSIQVNTNLSSLNIPIILRSFVEKTITLRMSLYDPSKNTYKSTNFFQVSLDIGFIFSCRPICTYDDIYFNRFTDSTFDGLDSYYKVKLRTNLIYTAIAIFNHSEFILDNPIFSILNTTIDYTFNYRYKMIETFSTLSVDLQLNNFQDFIINCKDEWGLYNLKFKLLSNKIYVEYECIELRKLLVLSSKSTIPTNYSNSNLSLALLTLSNHFIDCNLGYLKSISFVDINEIQFKIDYSCYAAFNQSFTNNETKSYSYTTTVTNNNTLDKLSFLNINRTNPIISISNFVYSIRGVKFSNNSSSISINLNLLLEGMNPT